MAISRQQKEAVVDQIKDLLQETKLTVLVNYSGVNVEEFQKLRLLARKRNLVLKVVKNSLFKKALLDLKLDSAAADLPLEGMILYVFSLEDEVAGPQLVREFVRQEKASLQFVAALTDSGDLMSQEMVSQLAALASKPELLAQLFSLVASPLAGLRSNLNNLSPLLQSLSVSKN